MPKKDPCQTQACRIQDCLQANNYQIDRCEHIVEQMIKCCEKFAEKSVCCSGFLRDIEKRKKEKSAISKSD